MSGEPIAERVQPVYQKDLYGDYYTLNIRIDSDSIEHGDKLHVQIQDLDNRDTDTAVEEEEDKSRWGEYGSIILEWLRNLN